MSKTPSSTSPLPEPGSRFPDFAFKWVAAGAATMIVILIVMVGWQLYMGSRLALSHFGFGFLWSSEWDPVQDKYGALPFIFGTLGLVAPGALDRRASGCGHRDLLDRAGAP